MPEIHNGFESYAPVSKDNTWARIELRKAEAFSTSFEVAQTLDFKIEMQSAIFNLYFAHYSIRKDNNNTHYLINHPAGNSLRKIPVLRKLPEFMEKVYNEQEEAAKTLLDEAKTMSESFEKIVRDGVYEEIARKFNVKATEVETVLKQDSGTTMQDIINAFGSPNAIQRAANLLSSLYVESKKIDEQAYATKVKKALLEIKKRDFTPTA